MFASYPPLTVLRRSKDNYATLGDGRLASGADRARAAYTEMIKLLVIKNTSELVW
jgi:hypothetical protein